MRKFFVFVVIALLCSSVAFASVGIKKDGDIEGNATYIDIRAGLSEFSGNTVSLYANGYRDGVTTNVSGESNLVSAALAYGVILKSGLDTTSDVKSALANGTPGQMLTIVMTVAPASTGDWFVTNTGISSNVFTMTTTGWSSIEFDAAYESVTLLYVDDTYGWIIVGAQGVAVT